MRANYILPSEKFCENSHSLNLIMINCGISFMRKKNSFSLVTTLHRTIHVITKIKKIR